MPDVYPENPISNSVQMASARMESEEKPNNSIDNLKDDFEDSPGQVQKSKNFSKEGTDSMNF